ncbi:50S ribosomal protein L25 [Ureibacillus massiliensis 4400831 = CIP 108448 = CCUG 49529]|uniref:Large ribosomal subunit protein bL25 n=1 Tax=Ureibacillus massiliensis 4400831 = CIP 108448 = CCUG 49529 TaxID=1211035 RepID=A0A0A3ITQ9_9BACL|nr:50S ribosomal protein L25/general stress protein Ctc [Ureibacillus massiliensis]KGR88111.1 50S ribosomal protein L25 [Ureibacillus massiliensis 4400831 = CIP 108448 = CCUG 49529]
MSIELQATRRNIGSRSSLTSLRSNGKLPAVLYGYNTETMPIVLDYKETAKTVQKYGRTSVFEINVEGKKVNAILHEIQRCPLKGIVKHVDFLSINMEEKIEVEVPIVPTGDAEGVKEGGILTQPVRELRIKVKPSEIPEHVEIDVTSLGMGESLSVRDLTDKVQYEILNADEDTIVTITPPVVFSDDTAGQGDNENQDIKATDAPESQA